MINLQLTQSQYDSIMAAVTAYNENLMKALEQEPKTSFTLTTADGRHSATVEVPVRPWDTPRVDAPYGLKKDGTPKARPGRKTARKARS